jgi:hypothetical protein
LYGAAQNIESGGQEYFGAVAVNWDDIYAQGLRIDFRLIEDIVCKGCASAQDVHCDIYDIWGGFKVATARNLFSVPSMDPHSSNAYRFKCKYL